MDEGNRCRDHEQALLQLLDEMGRSLARQERLLEEIEGRHVRVRNFWVQEGAEPGFEEPDQDALVDGLQWEMHRRREQELELHRILDVLKHRCELQDRVFKEVRTHLVPEQRDQLFRELEERIDYRERLLEDVELTLFEEKRDRISEIMELLAGLEEVLFKVVERHLVRMHQSGTW